MLCLLLKTAAFADPEARCGTPFLSVRPHPGAAAKKTADETFDVGDPLTVRAYNFGAVAGSDPYYLTTTTCRLKGEHCYIFVEDDIWSGSRVTPQRRRIPRPCAFDRSTPRYRERGIFSIDTEIFGPPPDADGDPRILIVILDIMDSSLGGTFVGYYDTANQAAPVGREILYIDSNPLDLDSNLARATLAHEFQHMLHWNADPDENRWVDEGCSEYAELACGYKDTTGTAGQNFLGVRQTCSNHRNPPHGAVPSDAGLTDAASWSAGNLPAFPLRPDLSADDLLRREIRRFGRRPAGRRTGKRHCRVRPYPGVPRTPVDRFDQFWSQLGRSRVRERRERTRDSVASRLRSGQKRYRRSPRRQTSAAPSSSGASTISCRERQGFTGLSLDVEKRQRPAGDTGFRTGRHTRRRRRHPSLTPPAAASVSTATRQPYWPSHARPPDLRPTPSLSPHATDELQEPRTSTPAERSIFPISSPLRPDSGKPPTSPASIPPSTWMATGPSHSRTSSSLRGISASHRESSGGFFRTPRLKPDRDDPHSTPQARTDANSRQSGDSATLTAPAATRCIHPTSIG